MRKILNTFLAIAIFTTYSSGGIMSHATINKTPASSIDIKDENGNVISSAYYSGGGSITFDFLAPPPPFLTLTTPGIEAGCNGLDFKGFFYNLLGIDQMGETISNAGSSLAYGVAVGLIYSLPGVAKAFSFIRKWANKIQQLLANACSAGIALGKQLGDWAGSDLKELETTMNDAIDKVDGAMVKYWQKGQSAINEALGISDSSTTTIPEMTMTEKSASIIAFFQSALQSDSSILGILLTDLATRSKVSGALFEDMFVKENLEDAITVSTVYILAGDAEEGGKGDKDYGMGIDKIAHMASSDGSLTGKDMTRLALFSYVLLYNYIGDIGISAPDAEKYNNLFSIANTATPVSGSSATSQAKAKTASEFKEAKKDSFVTTSIMGPGAGIRSSDTAGRNLAEFIWIGTKASDASANRLPSAATTHRIALNGGLIAPMATIYTLTLENSAVKAYIPVLSNLSSGTDKKFFTDPSQKDFTGVLDQSTCIIQVLIDGNGTITSADGCGEVPFVYPEMHKYIKVIKNSPNFEKPRLENILILSMAANMANALLYGLDDAFGNVGENKSKLVSASGAGGNANPKGTRPAAKKTAKLLMELIKKKSIAMREAKKILQDELSAGFALKTKVEGIFLKQAMKNRERGLKALQK